jgi:catalase
LPKGFYASSAVKAKCLNFAKYFLRFFPICVYNKIENYQILRGVLDETHTNFFRIMSLGGLKEGDASGKDHTPYIAGNLVREKIERKNDFAQAGERYRTIDQWERDDLVFNLVDALSQCNKDIQERMIGLLRQCDEEYGQRVADGLANGKSETAAT